MKNKLLILVVLLSFHCTWVLAVSAYPYPINITQPDGSKITIMLKGDEHFNYAQTTDGFIIARNIKGIYEYIDMDASNEIKLSGVKANNKDKRNANETQYIQTLQKQIILERLLMKQSNIVSKQQSSQDASSMSTTTSTPITGNRKILCILIGFQDRAFSKTQTEFNNLMNHVGYSAGNAFGSVRDFYLENSYGQLNLEITVVGPYIADHNMAYYSANDVNGHDLRPRDLITEAVQKANPAVNYADFDNNNDGYVDGVHVIYSGYAEAFTGAPAETIWPHKWTIPDLTLDGKKISAYSCTSELKYFWGADISGIGTICHEIGHVLGASDFYDTNRNTGGQFEGTGQWDLMSQGSWNGDEDIPAHHNPYTKTQIFNWATAQSLPADNTLVNLNPANSSSNSFYKIYTTTFGEYFLLENRQQLGFDSALPGHGMMVYHVHSQIESDRQAINTTFPQKFYPVCASATQNPDNNPISYGTINSFGCPFPGSSSKSAFTANTTPSAISWGGIETGKNLYFITESGNNISFVINPTISGPSELCYNQSGTFSINNLPTGATVSWYASGLSPYTGTGTTFTASPVINAGAGYVRATITVGQTVFTLQKDLSLNGYVPIDGPDVAYLSQKKAYFTIDASTVTRWFVNGVSITPNPLTPNRILVVFNNYPGDILVSCKVTSSCGTFEAFKSLQVIDDLSIASQFRIYPNPATDLLNVSLTKSNDTLENEALLPIIFETVEPYSIQLWSERSGLVKTIETDKSTVQIPLHGLPKGMYYVHLISDKKMVKKQILWIK